MSYFQIRAEEIFPEDSINQELEGISKFIKGLPCSKVPMAECGSERLTKEETTFIAETVDAFVPEKSVVEKTISPKMLFYGLNGIGRSEPDGKATFAMWDRVINCRNDCAVPLGWRGTVIGVVPESRGSLHFKKSTTNNGPLLFYIDR